MPTDVELRPRCLAMVTPAWPPGVAANGIVTYTSQLTPALRECSVRPVILSWEVSANGRTDGPDGSPTDVVNISAFRPSRGLIRKVLGRTTRLLRGSNSGDARTMIERALCSALDRFPIELIEMEEAFGLATRVVEMGRIPVVIRLHGPWFLNGEALGAKKDAKFAERVKQEGEAIARVDAVSAPTRDVLDRTRAYYNLPLEGARVIPHPVEWRADQPVWELANCDRNRIVFVGRFDLHKGADVLIDAFARLAATRPALELDFVGPDRGVPDGAGGSIGIAEYLGRHISDPGIRSRINVHGQKSLQAANDLRRRGFATVVPSRYETFGYTAAEAMSLGCPLVAANSGALAEIVQDGKTGLLFRSADPESLAAQLERLLSAPEVATQLGRSAQVAIRERHNPLAIAKETLEFYAVVINRWMETSGQHKTAGNLRPAGTG